MSDEPQVASSIVSDVTEWLCVFAGVKVRFVRGQIDTGHGMKWTSVKMNRQLAPRKRV